MAVFVRLGTLAAVGTVTLGFGDAIWRGQWVRTFASGVVLWAIGKRLGRWNIAHLLVIVIAFVLDYLLRPLRLVMLRPRQDDRLRLGFILLGMSISSMVPIANVGGFAVLVGEWGGRWRRWGPDSMEGRLHRLRLSVARWIRRRQVVSDSSATAHHGLLITGDACLMLEGARVKPDDRGRQLLSRPVRVECLSDGDLGVHFSQLAAWEHVEEWWNGRCVVWVSSGAGREVVVRKERYGAGVGGVGRRRRGSATAGWRQRGGGQHGPGADIMQAAAQNRLDS